MFLKMKLNVLIFICIGIVLFFLFYKLKPVVNPDVNHSAIPYNPVSIETIAPVNNQQLIFGVRKKLIEMENISCIMDIQSSQ